MKRRFCAFIICCMILLSCTIPAYADSSATYVKNITTVTSDASCQVTLQVNIRMESMEDNVTFPLPLGAKDVKVNNSSARATKENGALQVDISNIVGDSVGDHSIKFDFRLENVVTFQDDKYILELPLLCGFEYTVESMEFTITLPGDITYQPSFSGGYRQTTVESIMTIVVQDNMISGSVNAPLDDQETLTMTLQVPEHMFPSVSTFKRTGNPEIIPMVILGVLAIVYWLIFLRNLPLIRTRRTTAPEGVSAGELGCRLTLAGADLTMMVFHWAQMGYLLIHLDENGRVILHKRMDMGNERSLFEVKTFRSLFGKRRVVDGTGYQYAQLARKLSRQIPGEKAMISGRAIHAKIFRLIGCSVNLFGGICLAMNMTGNQVLQIFFSVIFAAFGVFSAWHIQGGMYKLHIRGRQQLMLGMILGPIWLILGIIAGQFLIALIPLLVQILFGLMAAFGGRRTDLGRVNASQILGLRQHLLKVDKEELHRLRKNDPEYFFNMAPFALTMGVEKKFSGKFGRKKLPPCPYLISSRNNRMDALHWAQTMKQAADILDARKKKMEREQFAIIKVK